MTAPNRLRTQPIVAVVLFVTVGLAACAWMWAGVGAADAAKRQNLIAPAGSCGDPSVRATPNQATKAMACMTNYARAVKGLPRYRVKADLNGSAERKAADILRCDAFSHTACGRPFSYWISRTYISGRRCWSAGENIAWGSGTLGSVRSIFNAWMNSPGHREAILSRDYRDLGIGLVTGRFEGRPGAAVWVQHFGRLC